MPDTVTLNRYTTQPQPSNPYSDNGGTIIAIAGINYAVIAGDNKQSHAQAIQTRYAPKIFRLTDRAVLAVNGFAADGNMFVKKVKQRLDWYRQSHGKDMPIRAIAHLIQTTLYARRFIPYYVYNLLGGIEEDGSGAVYSFDPVGSYERQTSRAAGAAQALLQPFLDSQIYSKNHSPSANLPLQKALGIVIDSFTSAADRRIEVGDGMEIYISVSGSFPVQTLQSLHGLQEVTSTQDGERVFVLRRNLKRN